MHILRVFVLNNDYPNFFFKEGGDNSQLIQEIENFKAFNSKTSVTCWNDIENKIDNRPISRRFISKTSTLYHIQREGLADVHTTAEHPFYVDGEGWVRASQLEVGDLLVGPEKRTVISGIEVEHLDHPIKVYNIEVEEFNNYFVSGKDNEEPILVHNCNFEETARKVGEYSKGFVLGASEALPGATQNPPPGSDTFEAGREAGHIASGTAQVTVGISGVVAGETVAGLSCMGAACAAVPAGATLATASAGLAAHGTKVLADEMVFQKKGEPTAKAPVGRRGSPADFANPNRNTAGEVNGRKYADHAFDRMQERGYTPSVIENAIETGTKTSGKKAGRSVYKDTVNKLEVVIEDATGEVVTIIPK